MPLQVLMMATGDFALPTFRHLHESEHSLVGLVTQPDKTGRGHHRHVNELKTFALEHRIPVFQPERVSTKENLAQLRRFGADIFVVAAYGQILAAELLEIPRLGAINLHGSLLPKFRGAAPVQYAIWEGEEESGITIFQIEPKLDAGPILAMRRIAIGPEETAGELHDRLAELAAPLTLEVLDDLEAGALTPQPQPSEPLSRAPKIRKHQGAIDWNDSAERISNQVRAMQPWPKAFTNFVPEQGERERIIIVRAKPAPATEAATALSSTSPRPGALVEQAERLFVVTGDGLLEVLELQAAGKRVMRAAEFLRGRSIEPGDHFEKPESEKS